MGESALGCAMGPCAGALRTREMELVLENTSWNTLYQGEFALETPKKPGRCAGEGRE